MDVIEQLLNDVTRSPGILKNGLSRTTDIVLSGKPKHFDCEQREEISLILDEKCETVADFKRKSEIIKKLKESEKFSSGRKSRNSPGEIGASIKTSINNAFSSTDSTNLPSVSFTSHVSQYKFDSSRSTSSQKNDSVFSE